MALHALATDWLACQDFEDLVEEDDQKQKQEVDFDVEERDDGDGDDDDALGELLDGDKMLLVCELQRLLGDDGRHGLVGAAVESRLQLHIGKGDQGSQGNEQDNDKEALLLRYERALRGENIQSHNHSHSHNYDS